MTNYNDGNWHGWNGGGCPVHPNTEVEYVYLSDGGSIRDEGEAKWCDWCESYPYPIVAFRVVKEHKEPREFWLATRWSGDERRVLDAEPDYDGYYCDVIHVREVME